MADPTINFFETLGTYYWYMYLLEADSDLYGNDPQIRSDNSSIVPPKRDDVEVGTGARG